MRYEDILRARAAEKAEQAAEQRAELEAILDGAETEQRNLDDAETARTDELIAGIKGLEESAAADLARADELLAVRERETLVPVYRPAVQATPDLDDTIRADATPAELRSNALRIIDRLHTDRRMNDRSAERAARLANEHPAHARHIATFGTDRYKDAFMKAFVGRMDLLTPDEARALAIGTATSAGNYLPTHFDPTIVYTNNGPGPGNLRNYAKVVTLPSPGPSSWNALSSAGVTASWDAEAAEVSDDSPTNTKTNVPVYKGAVYVEASVEALEDAVGLEANVLDMFSDARDRLEDTAFVTGSGSAQPTGIFTAIDATAGSEISNTTAATLGLVDIHKAWYNLPARFQANAKWLMHTEIASTVRQLGTAVAASYSGNLPDALGGDILGREVILNNNCPTPSDSTTTVENWLVVGDFSNYIIVDKGFMSVQFNPMMLHTTTNLPKGSVGWYAHFRTGADSINDSAFRLLQDITSA